MSVNLKNNNYNNINKQYLDKCIINKDECILDDSIVKKSKETYFHYISDKIYQILESKELKDCLIEISNTSSFKKMINILETSKFKSNKSIKILKSIKQSIKAIEKNKSLPKEAMTFALKNVIKSALENSGKMSIDNLSRIGEAVESLCKVEINMIEKMTDLEKIVLNRKDVIEIRKASEESKSFFGDAHLNDIKKKCCASILTDILTKKDLDVKKFVSEKINSYREHRFWRNIEFVIDIIKLKKEIKLKNGVNLDIIPFCQTNLSNYKTAIGNCEANTTERAEQIIKNPNISLNKIIRTSSKSGRIFHSKRYVYKKIFKEKGIKNKRESIIKNKLRSTDFSIEKCKIFKYEKHDVINNNLYDFFKSVKKANEKEQCFSIDGIIEKKRYMAKPKNDLFKIRVFLNQLGGHAVLVQIDKEKKKYRIMDDNIGNIETNNEDIFEKILSKYENYFRKKGDCKFSVYRFAKITSSLKADEVLSTKVKHQNLGNMWH